MPMHPGHQGWLIPHSPHSCMHDSPQPPLLLSSTSDLRPLLDGVLKKRWVGTTAACAVIDALVQNLGMDLLEQLPDKEKPDDLPWSPAELAFFSPAVLQHMITKLRLNVNARLGAYKKPCKPRVMQPRSQASMLQHMLCVVGGGACSSRRLPSRFLAGTPPQARRPWPLLMYFD